SCPAGSALGCNPTGVPSGSATATDNCGTPNITSSLGNVSVSGCTNTQVRTYTATDACGNSSTCTQTFTWTADTTAPVFTSCPAETGIGSSSTRVPSGSATATDN